MENNELEEFIADTLTGLAKGIRKANKKILEENISKDFTDYFFLRANRGDNSKIPGIIFDIALNVTKGKSGKKDLKVATLIGGGLGTVNNTNQEKTHRIKFELGIYQDFY